MALNSSLSEKLTEKEIFGLNMNCTRFLSGHYRNRMKPRQVLEELADALSPDLLPDNYGQGELIESFEQEIAGLLGKEAAVFMPSGTMCQTIALKIWADRKNTPNVAFHPKCHLEIHENKGYQMLYGLHGVLAGASDELMTLDDLKRVREPLAALLIELPQREIGGKLPQWEQLEEMVNWARENKIPTHLDGARLWECKPFYKKDYAEIAALFDTVYVSFYKILGGTAGSILAGPSDFISEARIWQHRQGGRVVRMFPFVLSARKGMVERLEKMEAYHQKALEIAEVLNLFNQVSLVPDPPQTNMMHVFLKGERRRLEAASLRIAEETKTFLFYPLQPTPVPNYSRFELTVGDAALDLSKDNLKELFTTLFKWAE